MIGNDKASGNLKKNLNRLNPGLAQGVSGCEIYISTQFFFLSHPPSLDTVCSDYKYYHTVTIASMLHYFFSISLHSYNILVVFGNES